MNFFPCTRRRPRPLRRSLVAVSGFSLISLVGALLASVGACRAGGPTGAPVYSLDDCLALVRKQNPDVIAAAKRAEAARAAITTAKATIYPALTSAGYIQYREQSLTTEGGATPTNRKEDYSGDVRLSQRLYSAQADRNRIAAAKLQAEAETNTYQAQIDTSSLAARLAFYQTLYAEASIAIRQHAVDLLASQLKDQQDRLAAGSVGQLNVNRAQVALANEQPSLLDAQSSVQTAYVTLAQLLGVAYPENARDRPFRVRGELSCPPLRMTLAECLARAQAVRPEVSSRKLAIEVLKHQVVVEKSGTRPLVTAYAAYDIYSEPSILSTRDNFSGYTLGLQASWTIFDGFATRGRVRGVQAQLGQAQAQLEATRQQVETDVRTAFYDLRLAADTLPPQASNIRLANETLSLYTGQFDAGLSSQLEVLQSRVDLTRAELTELGIRLRYHNALARLERAMGLGRATQGRATALPVPNK